MYTKVSNNTFKFLEDLINLNILIILKALITEAAVPKSIPDSNTLKTKPKSVPNTIIKSN